MLELLVFPTIEPKLRAHPYPVSAIIQPIELLEPLPELQYTTLPEKPLKTAVKAPQRASKAGVNSAGNGYRRSQCTWWAKHKRPDLPNNLGNANRWFDNARAQGIPVGYEARAGAVGQSKAGMHVVYIERVNGDGTVYLSEMNYDYRGSFRYRTASASEFKYIY